MKKNFNIINCLLNTYLLFDVLLFGKTCDLSGYDSGHCVLSENYKSKIPFCSDYLYKYICIPYEFELWKSNYTIAKRDNEVEEIFIQGIEKGLMMVLSDNPSSTALGSNRALIVDMSCYEKYKEFLCAMNFPFCNIKSDKTLQICTEKCLNYINACGYTNTLCSLTYVNYVINLFIFYKNRFNIGSRL